MTKDDLISFEQEVADAFARGEIRGPTHLVGGNEDELIEIFKQIQPNDWIFSTYRSHYHALLHGVPRKRVMTEIMAGRSMNMFFPEYRFFTSAIVAGCLPIAVGMAYAMPKKRGHNVICFIGDMAASTGAYAECLRFAHNNNLPFRIIVEDNRLSCNTPTDKAWGTSPFIGASARYQYGRTYPHVGIDKWVQF